MELNKMQYRILLLIVLLFAMIMAVSVTGANAQLVVSETGSTGMTFLSVAAPARIAAMGGLATAGYVGASSIWSNPSSYGFDEERSAQYSHLEMIDNIRHEFAALTTPIGFGNLGVALHLFDSGDIELRGDYPTSDPLGNYSITNAALSIGYAYGIADMVSAGITYKRLFERNYDEQAGGQAFDIGVTYLTPLEGLAFGVSGRNIGRMEKLRNNRSTLPTDLCTGVRYSGDFSGGRKYAVVADIIIPEYYETGFRAGFEIMPADHFLLRTGYRSDSDIEMMSYGMGIAFDRLGFDFAYTPMTRGFGNAFRMTVSTSGF
jgi:hypothetical protein